MKLEKYLNEKVRTPGSIIPQKRLVSEIDINIKLEHGVSFRAYKNVEGFIKKILEKELSKKYLNITTINIDSKYE